MDFLQLYPCNTGLSLNVPAFVGNDYYCESGLHMEQWDYVLYSNDFLWDGNQCLGPEAGCCTNTIRMPYGL